MFRWVAVVLYRTDNGPVDVTHYFEEMTDLNDLIERGPMFDTIMHIAVVPICDNAEVGMTVEQAARL